MMTRGRRRVCVALLGAVALVCAVSAQKTEMAAADAWVKLPAPGDTTALAFAAVENSGMYAAYLVSATSDVAGKIEFRDASKGPEAVAEVTVPANGTAYLNPKGIHMVLSDLKRPLKEGDKISIVLTTELDIRVEVSAVVRKE